MRVTFFLSGYDSISFVMASMVFYDQEDHRIYIFTDSRNNFVSVNEISYEDYLELSKNIMSYGYMDLSNIPFEYIVE